MNTVHMNMVRIQDDKNNVVVLDKKKKYGWEGLTFPGGKVDFAESFYDSAVREVKEETNLDIKNLEFNGIIQWIDKKNNIRDVGYLYTSRDFSGELIQKNREGNLFFYNYDEFHKLDGLSDSMDYILDIFDGKYIEIIMYYEDNKFISAEYR